MLELRTTLSQVTLEDILMMQFFDPFEFFDFFFFFPILFFFIFFVIAIAVGVAACRRGSAFSRGSFRIEAPAFVVQDQPSRTRADGTDIRTVRIPTQCPHCKASLSHEGIDWVGPLEAKCNYCGGTVKATFERI